MTAYILSATHFGFDNTPVTVEGDIKNNLPGMYIIGMGSRSVDEAKERVRSAITNSGFTFPPKKIVINLSPAGIAKDGTQLDLAIAVNILVLSGQLSPQVVKNKLFLGELGLDGEVKPIKNVLGLCEANTVSPLEEIFVPKENLTQVNLLQDNRIKGVSDLKQLVFHLLSIKPITHQVSRDTQSTANQFNPLQQGTIDDIVGQPLAKRAAVVAAAGHHNILLSGPPGVGKTMIAKAMASLLPPLTPHEAKIVTKIHSVVTEVKRGELYQRPFRAPHHTASYTAIVGGGRHLAPGEISLAHSGVLFLDELPEYNRNVIEALRQPLEGHKITLSRADGTTTYPASFILVATMNPCPCGYYGDPDKECTCTTTQIRNYQKKISGPLRDRIDISLQLTRHHTAYAPFSISLQEKQHALSVEQIIYTKHKQYERYKRSDIYNGNAQNSNFLKLFEVENEAKILLNQASENLKLSSRSYQKILRVARTIADLGHSSVVTKHHITEAIQFSGRN